MNNDPFALTPEEMRLIQAYRRCNDNCQNMMVLAAELHTKSPLLMRPEAPKPAFRLIAGGKAAS